jgi:photosystem II stability/assembly factor-like uncharacterized protein
MLFAAPGFRRFAFALALAVCAPTLADIVERDARDVGPEDGILCCNGLIPFLFHGDEVLTTTGRAGIFRSKHRGAQWRRSMENLVGPNGVAPQVASVCQAPSEPRTLYALAGTEVGVAGATPFNGLFSSDDFGSTWTRRASVRTGFGFATCTVDPEDPRTVYVSAIFDDNPWKSRDGGQTVHRVDSGIQSFLGAIVHPVRDILYVANLDAVFASTDGGASYHALSLPPGFITGFQVSPDGRALFFTTRDPETFAVTGKFRSTDGGSSFVAVSGLPEGIGRLAFDPTNASRIYAGGELLHVSTDGGLHFELLPASNDPRFLGPVREIGVDSRGSVYVATLAGPFRTDDGGQSFSPLLNEFRASAVNDLAFDADGKLLVGVINTRVILRQTHDGAFDALGHTPVLNAANGFRHATAVAGSPADANIIVVAGFGGPGLWRTGDGGRSWTTPTVAGNPTNYNQARMAFASASRIYLASPALRPGLYVSDDAGQTFALFSTLPFGAVAVDPTDPDIVYIGHRVLRDGEPYADRIDRRHRRLLLHYVRVER